MNEKMDVILRGRKFKKLIGHMFGDIRRKYNLSQIEIEILLYLNENPHTSASEIYRAMYINKGQVSQAMDKLCKKGYLESEQDKSDRRYVSYTVTDAGNVVIEESLSLRQIMKKQVFVGISEEEIEMMCKISAKLCDNIDGISIDQNTISSSFITLRSNVTIYLMTDRQLRNS